MRKIGSVKISLLGEFVFKAVQSQVYIYTSFFPDDNNNDNKLLLYMGTVRQNKRRYEKNIFLIKETNNRLIVTGLIIHHKDKQGNYQQKRMIYHGKIK